MEQFWSNLTAWGQTVLNDIYKATVYKDRWLVYLAGLGNTLLITVCALAIGILIGLTVALLRVWCGPEKNGLQKLVGKVCSLYTTVIRGTPVIVQLLILYTVALASADGLLVCIVGFGINSGAYLAEVARSGIGSVDPGQMEAGRSLGLSYGVTMRRIVLPQAVKNILPALFNEFIALLKETSVAGYIAVRDLTKAADGVRGITFNSVPLYLAALVYLLLVIAITAVQKRVERRMAQSDRN